MKREYSYGSIILVTIVFAIIGALVKSLLTRLFSLEETSLIVSLVSGIISWIGSFIIAAGLITNRTGSVGDYFNQAKRIDGKAIVVNLIIIVIASLITLFLGGGISLKAMKGNSTSIESLLSLVSIGLIVGLIFHVVTIYANHVVADPRNKNQSIGSAISEVFSLGFKLLGKTMMVYIKYLGIFLIIFLALTGLGVFASDDAMALIGIVALVGILFVIYFLLVLPVISARIADNYLDYKGDICYEDDIFIEDRRSNNHTITRNY